MKKYYTHDDVARWAERASKRKQINLDKLSTELSDHDRDFRLGGLGLTYETLGMVCVAEGEFTEAIQKFSNAIEMLCKLFEHRQKRSSGKYLSIACFQEILIAYVTRNRKLIDQIVAYYEPETGEDQPASELLGKAIKCIALGELESAKAVLSGKRPRFERQSMGYADCLDAMAHKDLPAIEGAIQVAVSHWAKWAARAMKGLPPSVCFIHGVGLVRLAEQVFGKPLKIENDHLPAQLLAEKT